MEPKHRDPDILRHLYWDKQLSQQAIGQKLGVDCRTISLWMIKLGIPRRSQALATHLGNANHVELSYTAISFLSGCLLGDGTIVMNKSISAMYQHTNKHRAYIEWLRTELLILGIECCGNISERKQTRKDNTYYRTDETHLSYRLCTRSYPELAIWRKKWYGPNAKQPPPDLELTPITLRQWFIDDGNYRERTKSNREVRICNFSFTDANKQFLARQLKAMGIDTTVSREGFRVRCRCIDAFFRTIGPCPVPDIYGYKWPTMEHGKH